MLWAQDGLGGALSDVGKTQNLSQATLGQRLVAADFDNDERPDGAVLLNAGVIEGQQLFRIKLHFSAGQDHDLTFQSNETALAISALDVNRDGVPDLVVEQVFTHKRLRVWLNDGHGRFRPVRVQDFPPSTNAPCSWKFPFETQGCCVLALPPRIGSDRAIQIGEALRYASSSAYWRIRSAVRQQQAGSLAFHSPRSPPTFLPLITQNHSLTTQFAF